VTAIITHPDWDGTVTPRNDIAVLQLADPTRNASVPTLALIGRDVVLGEGTPGHVMGWGATESGLRPTYLRFGAVTVAAGPQSPTCRGAPTPDDPIDIFFYEPATMVCVNAQLPDSPTQAVNSCFGDSGGPLVIDQGGQWAVAGIASWGDDPCDQFEFPGVYARVSAYLDWIVTQIPELADPTDPVEPVEPPEPVDPTPEPPTPEPPAPEPSTLRPAANPGTLGGWHSQPMPAPVTPRFTG
jgi:secreted trypsin-like serine protease